MILTSFTAARANVVGQESHRPGAPHLTHDSPKSTLERWLQWCDPNGVHISGREDEGYETTDEAWEAIEAMLVDNLPDEDASPDEEALHAILAQVEDFAPDEQIRLLRAALAMLEESLPSGAP